MILFLSTFAGNSHYRIINSPIEHGIRSTLIIRQALQTDFGPYTCSLKNSHGYSSFDIRLEEQRKIIIEKKSYFKNYCLFLTFKLHFVEPFPIQLIVISTLAIIAIVMVLAVGTVIYRYFDHYIHLLDKKAF